MNHFAIDKEYWNESVTGCDEVGRGCLAGPVVTASLTWCPNDVSQEDFYGELRDSKELTNANRFELYPFILGSAQRIRVAVISNILVDQINVLRASLLGFEQTSPSNSESSRLFIDGNHKPVSLDWAKTLVKGENKLSAIAGASIVAKVIRDEMMQSMDTVFPGYGFGKHVGYPTSLHKQGLNQSGPCPLHRKSYKPVLPYVLEETVCPELKVQILTQRDETRLWYLWRKYQESYFSFCPRDDVAIVSHFRKHLGVV